MTFDDGFGDNSGELHLDRLSDDVREAAGSVLSRPHPPDVEELLQRVIDLITNARLMPLSGSAIVNKEEALALLTAVTEHLPGELRAARWLQKEREEYLAKMRLDGDEIMEAARARAQRMVQRTEVVKSAEHRARRIIEDADSDARRTRRACEDFCDEKLAEFEKVLERTHRMVAAGRQKLQVTPPPPPVPETDDDPGSLVFDQDR